MVTNIMPIALAVVLASTAATAAAFQPTSFVRQRICVDSSLKATVDPDVVTKTEYQDICGVTFDDALLEQRLERTKFLYPKHVEVIEDLAPIADQMVDNILLETGDKAWQPQDYLPDMTKEDCMEQVKELREMAAGVPDDVLVVLIGDMVTEEALPTYQTLLNTFEGCDDPTGTSQTAWARWSRGWTSEENRHGDLLNKYLYLGGRCDMRSIEVTIQHLITSGFNPEAQKDPYRGFVYTSFQERATKISHGNVGKLAREAGDKNLQKICAIIAGDEGRHEKAYQRFVTEILQRDPDGLINVFGAMMRGQIVMPAELMTDGHDKKLYDNFSTVAQRLGVYTALDYADIIKHLVKTWDLEHLEGLGAEAEKEREYLCRLPDRYRKLAERSMNKAKKAGEVYEPQSFKWIHDRKA
uniref:Acyl-[acyl-carrier-protein] desaturase n=1 Tax=Pseudictyota dubia TaxID=2749911 RepID=A0A7R9WFJ9_9STRA|mmetsp:Transcript_48739/g.90414  ORF Transcript_48739/g.90414 Transcript_48739/m.90414 type:complete len:412 (+) Transcript_48739:170-1405(+)|eukprot:CAMPEP_0197435582 /NCGR_PEP_ID=MMETSP1175-20131217/3157_1 /TAXON_ID=1003142 /ORGANISM="Triceratium dubium, Strain CCMP147" /LENGTH=411 /DNA_ID=CAMNT_0042964657 /DNA_START=117 /DNA_END=1352 /DNA_ORIENTATION=-